MKTELRRDDKNSPYCHVCGDVTYEYVGHTFFDADDGHKIKLVYARCPNKRWYNVMMCHHDSGSN